MTYTALTEKQKLAALALRFYQELPWVPKTGDYYTTSRNDLELYKVVFADEFVVITSYLPLGGPTAEWDAEGFLTHGFGPRRVYVPEFVLQQS